MKKGLKFCAILLVQFSIFLNKLSCDTVSIILFFSNTQMYTQDKPNHNILNPEVLLSVFNIIPCGLNTGL